MTDKRKRAKCAADKVTGEERNENIFTHAPTGQKYVVGGGFPQNQPLRVRGVGREKDNPRAFLVLLTEIPTDDEIRSFHQFVRAWRSDLP